MFSYAFLKTRNLPRVWITVSKHWDPFIISHILTSLTGSSIAEIRLKNSSQRLVHSRAKLRLSMGRGYFAGLRKTGDDFAISLLLILSLTLTLTPDSISNHNSNFESVFNLKFQFRFLAKCQSEDREIILPHEHRECCVAPVSRLSQVKFDPDWSDNFSHEWVQSSNQSEGPYNCSANTVKKRIDFSRHSSCEPFQLQLFVCSQTSSLLRCVHSYFAVQHLNF